MSVKGSTKYSVSRLEKLAVEAIQEHQLVFHHEVISRLPCQKVWFYQHLAQLDSIRDALELNKIAIKAELRRRWQIGKDATTQIALYKLIGTELEVERLNNTRHTISGELTIAQVIKPKIQDEEAE